MPRDKCRDKVNNKATNLYKTEIASVGSLNAGISCSLRWVSRWSVHESETVSERQRGSQGLDLMRMWMQNTGKLHLVQLNNFLNYKIRVKCRQKLHGSQCDILAECVLKSSVGRVALILFLFDVVVFFGLLLLWTTHVAMNFQIINSFRSTHTHPCLGEQKHRMQIYIVPNERLGVAYTHTHKEF